MSSVPTHRPTSSLQARMLSALLLSTALVVPGMAHGQVATDGTLGPKVNLSGNDIQVGANLGQIRGQNLFHSFERFGVQTNGRVTFTGPGGLNNVISRVTGGQVSSIDGTLASTVPNANVYLINPSGVVFGPNAKLDVPGSFHASTADELRFQDGAVFSALDPAGSRLTVAAPQAFGFLGQNQARIDVNGSQLEIRSGKTLSLTAGDVGITAATLRGRGKSKIQLAAQKAAGSVPVNADRPAVARDGSINIASDNLANTSSVRVDGGGGGGIRVEGGDVRVDGSLIFAVNTGGTNDQAGIDIAGKSLVVQERVVAGTASGSIATFSLGNGQAGPMRLTADDIQILGGSVFSTPIGRGGGGPITVQADRLVMDDGVIGSPQFLLGAGSSAETRVAAGQSISLRNGSSILSTSLGGDKPAGGITLTSGGSIALESGSIISAGTFSQSNGGTITIDSPTLLLDQSSVSANSFSAGSFVGTGNAGNVIVKSDAVSLMNGSAISTSTATAGRGGDISITSNIVSLQSGSSIEAGTTSAREGGTIDIEASALALDASSISATTTAAGNAGSVIIAAENVGLANQATISTSTSGAGRGGSISLTSKELVILLGGSSIAADTSGLGKSGTIIASVNGLLIDQSRISAISNGDGNAGDIVVTANEIRLMNQGQISTNTNRNGRGGNIFVATGSLAADGSGDTGDLATGLIASTSTDSTQDAGSIGVEADQIQLLNGAQISSIVRGQGNGGLVAISTRELVAAGQRLVNRNIRPSGILVSAEAGSSGNAGTAIINADGIGLFNGGQILGSTFSSGRGGSITVNADTLLVSSIGGAPSGILATAEPGSTGDAGPLAVTAGDLQLRDGGQISSSTSGGGNGGQVLVVAENILITGATLVGDQILRSGIFSNAEEGSLGNAGNVGVRASGLVEIRNAGQISSSTSSRGKGGAVLVQADRLLTGEQQFGTGVLTEAREGSTGDALGLAIIVRNLQNQGQISSSSAGGGNAGAVLIQADLLENRSGLIASSTLMGGNSGEVFVIAGQMLLTGGNGITTTTGEDSLGVGGKIFVQADKIELRDQAQISSGASSIGRAGEIGIAVGSLLMSGQSVITSTSIASGRAGKVVVGGNNIELNEGSQISSFGLGSGPAGDVQITADRLQVTSSGIATAGAGTTGGRIAITGTNLLYFLDSGVSSSGIEPAANASLITLQAPTIVLNNSQVESLTGAGQPLQGSGEANILGGITVISADSTVAASSSVETTGLQTDLGSELQLATGTFLDADRLLRESCAARGATTRSTFVRTGRGGLPPSPDRPLSSTATQEPLVSLSQSGGSTVVESALIPCQGEPLTPPS